MAAGTKTCMSGRLPAPGGSARVLTFPRRWARAEHPRGCLGAERQATKKQSTLPRRKNIMGRCTRVTVFVMGVLAFAASANAQASITGVVRDPSGSILPGVTVEASSAALIEKVRTVTTDGRGQYRIVDLRPGTYVVTYALPGFSTTRRE